MTQQTTIETWQRVERMMDSMLVVEHSEPYPHEDGTMGGEYSDYVYDEDHKFRNLIAAEIDTLTRERDEARANAERWHSELEKCQSALRLSLAGTEQHYFASPARIDDVRAELAEARAEVERLRPAAEAWNTLEEFREAQRTGTEDDEQRTRDAHKAARDRARAAKGSA